jgi:hypothetical protein
MAEEYWVLRDVDSAVPKAEGARTFLSADLIHARNLAHKNVAF